MVGRSSYNSGDSKTAIEELKQRYIRSLKNDKYMNIMSNDLYALYKDDDT